MDTADSVPDPWVVVVWVVAVRMEVGLVQRAGVLESDLLVQVPVWESHTLESVVDLSEVVMDLVGSTMEVDSSLLDPDSHSVHPMASWVSPRALVNPSWLVVGVALAVVVVVVVPVADVAPVGVVEFVHIPEVAWIVPFLHLLVLPTHPLLVVVWPGVGYSQECPMVSVPCTGNWSPGVPDPSVVVQTLARMVSPN